MGLYDDKEDLQTKLKTMSKDEMELFAVSVREKLIDDVSKNGGHLASNLGTVELTLALHAVFDVKKDRIIWDVGHQSYVHKLLTGRWDDFDTLRTHGGISGFPKRDESTCDAYDSGHSSTSVSAALGYAKARDLAGDDYACVAVIGDGALTGGVAYEALNAAGIDQTPLVVVLNDNGMSIGSNVGGMARHLNSLRTSSGYTAFKRSVLNVTKGMPRVTSGLRSIRDTVKYALLPGTIFEELGFKYFGPIDGHDIGALMTAFRVARDLSRPVLVHVVTRKGKGYFPAEKNPAKFHGIGAFNPETETSLLVRDRQSWSEIFGEALLKQARQDERICAVSAAMVDAAGLSVFSDMFPERCFDVGIAEQHAVSFAAGLALGGRKPVVAIYSTFLQRAYDQIITEVCLQKLPVVFAIDRAGITGRDGETHQGQFDIAYLSSMPNMTILSPKDEQELHDMLDYALSLDGPCAIRYGRGRAPELSLEERTPFGVTPEFLRGGEEMLFLSDGGLLPEVLGASELLKEKGIGAAVCHLRCLKPLPKDFLEPILRRYKVVITVEDGTVEGGFGQRVGSYASVLAIGNAVLPLGWPDRFIEHGSIAELRQTYGLDAASIARIAEGFLEKKA